jgi:hypothetical protein
MSPDNLNATVEKLVDEPQATEAKPINLADLAADYKVRHPIFSAPNVAAPEVDLTSETIPEPEAPNEEQKLYLTETGSADSTKKTWRDSSISRLYIMGSVFAIGAAVVGLMFNMKLPTVKTASVSMSEKGKTEETKEPTFAGDGDYAAQAALSAQDGAYGAAQNAVGHGYDSSPSAKSKPNAKPSAHSKKTAAHTVRMPSPRRASLPSTMAYNPAPRRHAYIPPTDDIPASSFRRRPFPTPVATAPASISRPSIPELPKQSAEERRLAAIAATSTTRGASGKEEAAAGAVPNANADQASQGDGYREAAYLPSESAVIEGIPQQLISRSRKAEGRLLMGVAFTPGDTDALNGQPVEVAIEDPLQSGLPPDSRIVATVDFPKAQGQLKTAVIRLTPTAIAIGDAEYPLPKGVVILTGKNGKPLIAKRPGSEFLRTLNSTFKAVLSGGLSGLSTLALGNGTGILSSLGGANALSGLTNLGKGTDTQQATEILALRENTAIQINIVKPLSLPATQATSAALPKSVSVEPDPASAESADAGSPDRSQSMMLAQDLTDAELRAIANGQADRSQPEVSQGEVQDVQ